MNRSCGSARTAARSKLAAPTRRVQDASSIRWTPSSNHDVTSSAGFGTEPVNRLLVAAAVSQTAVAAAAPAPSTASRNSARRSTSARRGRTA